MGMTTEFQIFDLFALDNVMRKTLRPEEYGDAIVAIDFDDYGHVLDKKWLVVLNAEAFQDLNPSAALYEKLESIGVNWNDIANCEIEVDCYLKET